jgi:DMSO/TMAO reductase YedYZ heme-binding membrane subunit
LLATLLVSPLARYAKQPLLIRTRRLLGLWCFAWATLHLTSYTLLELGINNLALLGSELSPPLSDVGFISWLILLALAATQRKRCSENWVVAGKLCTTSSIWWRSSRPFTTCGR